MAHSDLEAAIALIPILVVSVAAYSFFKRDEVIYRPLPCQHKADRWEAAKGTERIKPIRFRVSFQSQVVVDDSGTRLDSCSVFDKNTWACNGLGRRDGEFGVECEMSVCVIAVSFFDSARILISGEAMADEICREHSDTLAKAANP